MKKNTVLLIVCIVSIFSFKMNGQTWDYIRSKGYIINFGASGWFFQPCDNSSKSLYEALNKGSFHIYYGTDGYNAALWTFEDDWLDKMKADTVFYQEQGKSTEYVGTIKYKYVEMVYRNSFHPVIGTHNIPLCRYSFSEVHDKRKAGRLGCLFFSANISEIKSIIPD